MQREEVLNQALSLLEAHGILMPEITLIQNLNTDPTRLRIFWPTHNDLIYDCLRYHGNQIDIWQRRVLLDESISGEDKLLARYTALAERVRENRFPGCLFIAACSAFPDAEHPIHQLSCQQKQSAFAFTLELLRELDIDDCEMVAHQLELILEGCLSKLLISRSQDDIATARRLAEDVLTIARCRKNGALS